MAITTKVKDHITKMEDELALYSPRHIYKSKVKAPLMTRTYTIALTLPAIIEE